MELHFPNFKQSLLILGKISDTKYHICLLELLDFKNVQIADLLCKEPSSIGSARKRLYEELASKKGSAKDLKPFLHNLLSL